MKNKYEAAAAALVRLLRRLAMRIEGRNWREQHARRREAVGTALYSSLRDLVAESVPADRREWVRDPVVLEGPVGANYFPVPSGGLPRFDFIVPEVPLYVVVGGPCTASYEDASACGFDRAGWEAERADLDVVETLVPRLTQPGHAAQPRLLVLRWDEPSTHQHIYRKLHEAILG